jgi:hypothetical protein
MSLVYNNSLYIFPLCITGDHFPPFPNHDSGDPNTMEKLPSNNSFCASSEDTSFSDIALMLSEWSRFIWPLLSYLTGKQLLQWSCHLVLLIHTKANKQPPRHDISWTFRSLLANSGTNLSPYLWYTNCFPLKSIQTLNTKKFTNFSENTFEVRLLFSRHFDFDCMLIPQIFHSFATS